MKAAIEEKSRSEGPGTTASSGSLSRSSRAKSGEQAQTQAAGGAGSSQGAGVGGATVSPRQKKSRKRSPSSSSASSSSSSSSSSSGPGLGRRRKSKKKKKKKKKSKKKHEMEYLKCQVELLTKQVAGEKDNKGKKKGLIQDAIEEPDMSDTANWVWGNFEVQDDGVSPEKMCWELRTQLRPPNSDPKLWWRKEYIKTTVTMPLRGASLYTKHLCGVHFMNPAIVQSLHERRNFVHYKFLLRKNSGYVGTQRTNLNIGEDASGTVSLGLHKAWREAESMQELMEGLFFLASATFSIRPWSHEAIALLKALHDVRYFFNVTDDTASQLKVAKDAVQKVLEANTRRAHELSFPCTHREIMEIFRGEVEAVGLPSAQLLCGDAYAGKKSSGKNKVEENQSKILARLNSLESKSKTQGLGQQNASSNRGGFARGRGQRNRGAGGFPRNFSAYDPPTSTPSSRVLEKAEALCKNYNSGVCSATNCGSGQHKCSQIVSTRDNMSTQVCYGAHTALECPTFKS